MPTKLISRAAASLLLAVALCAIVLSLWQFGRFSSGTLLSDFRAFYCAADLARRGTDSYRQEPLYRCEAQLPSPIFWHAEGNVTDPAPLPPYALAVFVPLSLLPYGFAAAAWSGSLLGAWAVVVVVCKRLTGYSWMLCGYLFLFAAMMSVSLGQIAPVAIAAVCAAALALSRRRDAWAGAAAALAMIEPHVALPVCVALFVAVARSRVSMLGVGLLLLAVSLAFGFERNLEYLLDVLPAHQRSDVADVGQFSVTVLAHAMNFSDAAASRLGTIWYVVTATGGVAVACILARRTANRALLALVPMAFAVFGGPYVHWQQVVGAIPAGLVLLRVQRVPSPWLAAALVMLAIPWIYVVGWGFLIPGATAVAALLAWQLFKPSAIGEAAVSVGVFTALLMANHSLAHQPAPVPFIAGTAPSDWADLSWGAYVRARIAIGTGIFFWLHVPTWTGLAAIVATAAQLAASSRSGSAHAAGGSARSSG